MSLRRRILAGFGLILVLIVALGVAVVINQRHQLVDQLDVRLLTIAPLGRPTPPSGTPAAPSPPSDPAGGVARPLSDIYIATRGADGSLEPIVEGQLLDTTPDLASLAEAETRGRSFHTVKATGAGSGSFRVLIDAPATGPTTFFAVPTDEVDQTTNDLVTSFGLVAAAVATLLALAAWWIIRLGLRPITAMTSTALAITAGDRTERAPELDPRTEAGQLAAALNLMLDQRDTAEDTLRQFAADASHELRTPLTSIRGFLDLYSAGAFRQPGELDDVVRRMRGEADRMADLIDRLLQLARLDQGLTLQRSPTDLTRLVEDVAANARLRHPGRDIEVDVHAENHPALDGDKITQLVSILIDNALIHAPEAQVAISVRSSPSAVTLTVADDGPGLAPDDADKVFSRFYRASASRSRTDGGSGLGLAIAHSIVETHGGRIELHTAPGSGCTFVATLPLTERS